MPGAATSSPTGAAQPKGPGLQTPTPPTPVPAVACMPCATQEDFDEALRKKTTCCAVTACVNDAGCTGGRVCCRIPKGTLCTDAGRCAAGDRVKSAPKVHRGPCRTSNDCPDGMLCCDDGKGPGKPGLCLGVSDGIKGCSPPP